MFGHIFVFNLRRINKAIWQGSRYGQQKQVPSNNSCHSYGTVVSWAPAGRAPNHISLNGSTEVRFIELDRGTLPRRKADLAFERRLDLREILDYVGQREGVSYVPNCALVPTSAKGLIAQEEHLPAASLSKKKIYEDFPSSY